MSNEYPFEVNRIMYLREVKSVCATLFNNRPILKKKIIMKNGTKHQ